MLLSLPDYAIDLMDRVFAYEYQRCGVKHFQMPEPYEVAEELNISIEDAEYTHRNLKRYFDYYDTSLCTTYQEDKDLYYNQFFKRECEDFIASGGFAAAAKQEAMQVHTAPSISIGTFVGRDLSGTYNQSSGSSNSLISPKSPKQTKAITGKIIVWIFIVIGGIASIVTIVAYLK